MARVDRQPDQLRAFVIRRGFTTSVPGSVLIEAGRTKVLCTAGVQDQVPAWLGDAEQGWVTAEYSMLPGSGWPRKPRERGARFDGRSAEIQRLVGRSLRAITDLQALGRRTVVVDCDVLEADGGTRTASVTGAWVALVDAVRSVVPGLPDPGRHPIRNSLAAVSVGVVDGEILLDLDHREDAAASVDLNVVMTGSGQLVEIQGTGEQATFSQQQLLEMLQMAQTGIEQLTRLQQKALGDDWPLDRS